MANFFTYEDRLKIKEQMYFTEIGEKLAIIFQERKSNVYMRKRN